GSGTEHPSHVAERPGHAIGFRCPAIECPGSVIESPGPVAERPSPGTESPGSAVAKNPRSLTERPGAGSEHPRPVGSDLLEHPDPNTAAEAATVENLLRCWARETDLRAPDDGMLRIPLPASGTALLAPVHYWSPTGWHRFGLPYF